jgi:hypothetical protein
VLVALAVACTAQARTQEVIEATAGSADHAEGEGGVEYCTPQVGAGKPKNARSAPRSNSSPRPEPKKSSSKCRPVISR